MMRNRVLSLAILGALVGQCVASEGDIDPTYRTCLDRCKQGGCAALSPNKAGQICPLGCDPAVNGGVTGQIVEEPWFLKATLWDCVSECKYQCMVLLEAERAAMQMQPVKYHGKWPFRRVFGLQEPASVLFSLLNAAAHLHNLILFHRLAASFPVTGEGKHRRSTYPFIGLMKIYGLVNIGAWVASAIFHTRDTSVTEIVDYLGATAVMAYMLFLSIVVTVGIKMEAVRVMVLAPVVGFSTTHVLFLGIVKFDYGLHVTLSLIVGMTAVLIWAIWAGATRHPYRWNLWLFEYAAVCSVALEVLDFSPVSGIFDAHSLWHAATLPLTYMWWSFVRLDASYRSAKASKGKAE